MILTSKDNYKTELPANHDGKNRGRNDVDDVDENEHQVEAHKVAQCVRVGSEFGGERAACIVLIVEECHVLLEDKVEDLASVYPGDNLCDNVAGPANSAIDNKIADCDNEEHQGVKVALFYCPLGRQLEGFDDAREQDGLSWVGRSCGRSVTVEQETS